MKNNKAYVANLSLIVKWEFWERQRWYIMEEQMFQIIIVIPSVISKIEKNPIPIT